MANFVENLYDYILVQKMDWVALIYMFITTVQGGNFYVIHLFKLN